MYAKEEKKNLHTFLKTVSGKLGLLRHNRFIDNQHISYKRFNWFSNLEASKLRFISPISL